MADRNVTGSQTVEGWRTTYVGTSQDIGDIGDLNTLFDSTPTDLVEAANNKISKGELLKWIFTMTNDVE
jgi:hypothetical protein